mgnify:CR=1 FL=1
MGLAPLKESFQFDPHTARGSTMFPLALNIEFLDHQSRSTLWQTLLIIRERSTLAVAQMERFLILLQQILHETILKKEQLQKDLTATRHPHGIRSARRSRTKHGELGARHPSAKQTRMRYAVTSVRQVGSATGACDSTFLLKAGPRFSKDGAARAL